MKQRRQRDRVRHSPFPRRARPEPAGRLRRRTALELIHADEAIVVVSKPADVAIEPGINELPSLIEQVIQSGAAQDSDPLAPAYPVETAVSGVVLLARTEAAFAELSRQRADGDLGVHCLALVAGSPQGQSGVIDSQAAGRHHAEERGSRGELDEVNAVTNWTVRDTFIGYALLECTVRPPVPSIIRAHLASAGMPLAVDPLNGGGTELMLSSFKSGYHRSRRHEERPLIARPTLHVEEVRFTDPTTGSSATHRAALPKDFRATLHQFDRFGRVP